MKIEKESEILKPEIRKQIIDEIRGSENKHRKDEAFKRYECYKDLSYRYVIEMLLKWFDSATVEEMSYAISNISITRKIIDKLAKVYSLGPKRTAESDEMTKAIEALAKALDFNSQMKKVNRYLKLFKNTMCMVKPCKYYDGDIERWQIKVEALAPYLYDVVEDLNNREKPLVLILSNYKKNDGMSYSLSPAKEGRGFNTAQLTPRGDNKDQLIADDPSDQNAGLDQYIFWSKSYHFTCNVNGEIISGESIENPIYAEPFVNFSMDQDGAFWAIGGDDLAMGSILINTMISNINHIGITQGYGQLWMKGKNLPRRIMLGPTKAVLMEYQEGDPVPDMGFATANPPLADLMEGVKAYVALLLTTNNLSTSGISAQLSGGSNFASGIALIIDKAESLEDIQDQRQIFIDKEPKIWELIQKWHELYSSKQLLGEDLSSIKLGELDGFSIKFQDAQPIMSEAEKLTNIEKRKDLGLNTKIELLMLDDPSLTEQTAKEKLLKLEQDEADKASAALVQPSQNAMSPSDRAALSPDERMALMEQDENEGDSGAGL